MVLAAQHGGPAIPAHVPADELRFFHRLAGLYRLCFAAAAPELLEQWLAETVNLADPLAPGRALSCFYERAAGLLFPVVDYYAFEFLTVEELDPYLHHFLPLTQGFDLDALEHEEMEEPWPFFATLHGLPWMTDETAELADLRRRYPFLPADDEALQQHLDRLPKRALILRAGQPPAEVLAICDLVDMVHENSDNIFLDWGLDALAESGWYFTWEPETVAQLCAAWRAAEQVLDRIHLLEQAVAARGLAWVWRLLEEDISCSQPPLPLANPQS